MGRSLNRTVSPRKFLPAVIFEGELYANSHKATVISEKELHANFRRANCAFQYMTRSSDGPELDEKLWAETVSETTVDGPDAICVFVTFWRRCRAEQGRPTTLLGCSSDLASTYGQLAIADNSKETYFSVGIQPGVQLGRAFSTGCSAFWLPYSSECFHPLRTIFAMDTGEVFTTSLILLLRCHCVFLTPTVCKQLTGSLVFDVGRAWVWL